MNNTFELFAPSTSPDLQGGHSVEYVSQGEVLGQMSQKSGSEQINARQEEQKVTHVFYCETNNITRGWRIAFGEKTFHVDGVREPRLSDHHYEIDCYLIDPVEMLTP